jgi:L-gulonolactone oxidase
MLFPHTGKLFWQCRKFMEAGTPLSLFDPIASRGINLFKDVLLPLVKAGTAVKTSGSLAEVLSTVLIETPMGIFQHASYVIDPCDRGIVYTENDPGFDFYDWMFPEDKWCDMVQDFLKLCGNFQRENDFYLPLPVLIYFVKQDTESLLSRSRKANVMAIDPTYPDPKDQTWKKFRLEFNEIAMGHGGIPHINKTRDGAITHFAQTQEPDTIRLYLQKRQQFDPKDLFLNDFFREMFAQYL